MPTTVQGESTSDGTQTVQNLVSTGDIKAATFHVGNDAGVDATIIIPAVATITIKKGIITAVV